MGYRGEDTSRAQADRGRQPPWQHYGQPEYGQPEYGQYDDYDHAGDNGDPAGYADPAGYGQHEDYGYQQAADHLPGYGQAPGYDQATGYADGGYPGQDAGNDWYGGQPAAASGASFADTGTYMLSGRIDDEYGTGPNATQRDPVRGYPSSAGPQAPGYPTQERPRGRPRSAPFTGPQSVPHTGQQERYDGFDPRAAQDRADYESSPGMQGGYDEPVAYPAPAGEQRGRYDDYVPGPDPYADPPGDASGGRWKRAGRGGKHPLLLAAVAVVAVVIIGAAAYVFLFKPSAPASSTASAGPLPTLGSAPSAQACVKQYGTYCHIEARTDDPAPLTISELFPPAFTNEADKSSFSLVSDKLDKTCAKAVIGASLISALKAGKCTQVVRASYVSGNGKMMGTIGVVNLATTNEAHYAGKVVGRSDFVAPLAAAKGVAKKLGQGTGVVEAEFKGHYLILTWSEFTDGASPSTKAQDSELEQFSSGLVAGTANISLSQRMVTGAPAASGAAS